jgi:hypothetical protein
MSTGKIQITVEALKEDSLNGLNRKAIAQKYGIAKAAVDKLFKHPSLRGIRPKHASDIELVLEDGTAISPNIAAKDYVPTKKVKKHEGEAESDKNTDGAFIPEGAKVVEVTNDAQPASSIAAREVAESTGI